MPENNSDQTNEAVTTEAVTTEKVKTEDVENKAKETSNLDKDKKEPQDDPKEEKKKSGIFFKLLKIVAVLLVLACLVISIISYRFPDFFEPDFDEAVLGDATMSTLIKLSDDMLYEWFPNDVVWPTIFIDNTDQFQLGQLEVLRYSVRVLRDNLSRLRTTDKIDPNADAAYTNYSNDPMRWMLPSAEQKFKKGQQHLEIFRQNLKDKKANFYPRADNLIELLSQQNSLLGGVCTRLSVIPDDFNEFVSEDTPGKPSELVPVNKDWMDIDNEFYYAQGVAYSLRQLMVAVKVDFAEILKLKKADELADSVIKVLEHTQWEPKYMVMNCSPGSWIPCQNDPMMLSSRLQDTRQKIGSLIKMIQD